jgi:predicted  nucleic acid-binding Zn-ribbon protein
MPGQTPERCTRCSRPLDQSALEIGTGCCNRCGHAHYSTRTEDYRRNLDQMRKLTRRLVEAAGFSSVTAAEAFFAEQDRRDLAEGNGS